MRGRTRFARTLTIAAVVAIAATAGVTLAMPAPPQGGTAQIVVRAVDATGQPVLDLTAADLTLRIDGRAREIKSLELVQPGASAAPAATAAMPAVPLSNLPPPYATNVVDPAAPGAREFVIAIDDQGIAPGREQPVRDAARLLISSLSPGDAVGVVALKSGGMRLSPTTDRAAALEALGKISAMGSASESATDMGCRTKDVMANVGSLLADAPPSRTVVLFSSGVASPTGDQMRTRLGVQEDANAAVCQVRQRDLDELGRLAASSPAALYVVFVSEAVANIANRQTAEAGLENIAGVTGGVMFRMAGAENTVERVGRSAGTYYLATVDGAGSSQRIDARTSRDGVRVVARPVSTGADEQSAAPRDMIRTAAVFRALPLRAAGFVSRQPASKDLKVVALFEPHESEAKITGAVVGLFDKNGSLKAQWTAQPAELTRSPIMAALAIAPGTYRMRVAATDASGRSGTVDYALEASLDEAPPVQLSDMLIGIGQNGFVPRLQFTSEDAAAIGFLEIYGVAKDAKLDVTFEIAKDEKSEALGSGQGTVAAGPGEDARIAYGGFPVAAIEPGDYLLRAVVTVDGKRAGVASRTLRRLK